MRSAAACIVLLLVLAAPAGAAEAPVVADLVAASASLGGTGEAAGTLAVLDLGPCCASSVAAPTALHLTAQRVEARLAQRGSDTTVASNQLNGDRRATPDHWEDADLDAVLVGGRASVFAVPTGTDPVQVRVAADRPAAEATQEKVREHRPYVADPERAPLRAAVNDGIAVSGEEVALTLRGDFILSIWDIDLEDGKAGRRIDTGPRVEPVVGDPTGSLHLVERSWDTQAYLKLEGATLTLRLPALAAGELLAPGVDLSTADSLTFREPSGQLDGLAGAVDGLSLTLHGQLVASLAAQGGRLAAAVTGQVDRAVLDAKAISIEPAPDPAPWAYAWLLALPAAALATRAASRRRMTRAFSRAEEAMAEGRYARAADMPARLLRSRRHAAEAAVLQVAALLKDGRLPEASVRLDGWPRRAYPWDRDYLRAHLHGLRGEWVEAAEHLRACLEQAPLMAEQAAQNPVFAPLLHPSGRVAPPAAVPREGYT